MALSVIGAGLGRTGTMSLKLALEQLGFGPCYHMKEVFAHLDGHVPVWDQAARGGDVDWDALFDGYESAVDFPAASFYRELRAMFPSSRSRAFVYFAAFDAPWRVADEQAAPGFHPEEAFWGLYSESRAPKAAARELPPLAAPLP